MFEGIPEGFEAVQYNSLVVREEGLGEAGLECVGWGGNGGEEVMALRHKGKPLWGVQFHPEVGLFDRSRLSVHSADSTSAHCSQ